MKRIALVTIFSFGLSGCVLETIAVGGLVVSSVTATYCGTISDAGKEAVRDLVTAGKKVIACEEAEK